MTVIAFDGHTVAADRMCITPGNMRQSVTKLQRAPDGAVLAMMGLPTYGMMLFAWYCAGAKQHDFPEPPKNHPEEPTELAVFRKGCHIAVYVDQPIPLIIEDPIWAGGSGGAAAMAAMIQGANAQTAVHVACKVDAFCGLGCDVMEVLDRAAT